jgi:hypothetical protein
MWRFKGNDEDKDIRMAAAGFIVLLQKYQNKNKWRFLREVNIV